MQNLVLVGAGGAAGALIRWGGKGLAGGVAAGDEGEGLWLITTLTLLLSSLLFLRADPPIGSRQGAFAQRWGQRGARSQRRRQRSARESPRSAETLVLISTPGKPRSPLDDWILRWAHNLFFLCCGPAQAVRDWARRSCLCVCRGQQRGFGLGVEAWSLSSSLSLRSSLFSIRSSLPHLLP